VDPAWSLLTVTLKPEQVLKLICVLNRSTQSRRARAKYLYYFYKVSSTASPSSLLNSLLPEQRRSYAGHSQYACATQKTPKRYHPTSFPGSSLLEDHGNEVGYHRVNSELNNVYQGNVKNVIHSNNECRFIHFNKSKITCQNNIYFTPVELIRWERLTMNVKR